VPKYFFNVYRSREPPPDRQGGEAICGWSISLPGSGQSCGGTYHWSEGQVPDRGWMAARSNKRHAEGAALRRSVYFEAHGL